VKVTLPVVKEMETTEVVERRAVLAVTAEGVITLDNYELASPDLLTDALIVFRKGNPRRKLELAADRGATLAQLFLVLDALTAAQYDIKDVPARIRRPQPVDFVDPLQP
jgi:biopolymer transport protein ExbD